jgi:hypothetical protein
MPRLRLVTLTELLLYVVLALLLAWLGISVPSHFRAISPSVIRASGKATEQLIERSRSYLSGGQFSLSEILGEADYMATPNESAQRQIKTLRSDAPSQWLAGGSNPYMETYFDICFQGKTLPEKRFIVPLLIPRAMRDELTGFLGESRIPMVKTVLSTRELTGYTRFPPVNTSAGAPLDATIGLAALLAQNGAYSPQFRNELDSVIAEAFQNDPQGYLQLEQFYQALMGLGIRLDWTQLNEFIQICPNLYSFISAAHTMQADVKSLPVFYAAALLLDSPDTLVDYLQHNPEEGREALAYSLQWGKGAIEQLLEQDKPLYRPPVIVQWVDRKMAFVTDSFFASFASRNHALALCIKIFLLLASGFVLSILLERLLEIAKIRKRRWRTRPLVLTWNFLMAVIFAIGIWLVLEPSLLKFSENDGQSLTLDFVVANALESLKSQQIETVMIDQVTIIVLLLFFFLQLVVYVFNLMKIAEIRKQKLSAVMKLKLLENEENLFELGLYVGLSGTVLSLILLAMDIVQASLIAAYASTLFGIIFTAILKVFNIRNYRRSLLLQVEQGKTPKE